MNRPICQNCFFFGVQGSTCCYLLITDKKRDCTPTNHRCSKKMTEEQAKEAGYRRVNDKGISVLTSEQYSWSRNIGSPCRDFLYDKHSRTMKLRY